ncbi:hypothetical protein E2C01_060760 [Portunus trituberculatus]|uniref:Uncharacterized protein n=1 Tax=Portunus trituberculatus TaxID=210409 RepID=A0A5B7H3F9_PORTR|nr:hypothetical protein [Portunus trituberculatus]
MARHWVTARGRGRVELGTRRLTRCDLFSQISITRTVAGFLPNKTKRDLPKGTGAPPYTLLTAALNVPSVPSSPSDGRAVKVFRDAVLESGLNLTPPGLSGFTRTTCLASCIQGPA